MNNIIGIRHEDMYTLERRVAIIPRHVEKLIRDKGLRVQVEKSAKRIFLNEEYQEAGAEIVDKINKASVVFGVKEIPEEYFEQYKTYVFFSHVIKGQKHNMPMLHQMMKKGCTLIDYEKVVDETGKRLIFFGHYAGMAGMINSLWAVGQRYLKQGIDNPFKSIRQSHRFLSLDDAKLEIGKVGRKIAVEGMPDNLLPFVIGFTGYGNVSKGAMEIAQLLPSREISPGELLDLRKRNDIPKNIIYKVIFKEEDLYERIDGKAFDKQDYYSNPHNYQSKANPYLKHLNLLINGVYWDVRYPRIITKEFLKELYTEENPLLKVIGDISCDTNGSIEITHKAADIENPVYTYNPLTDGYTDGIEGAGIVNMAVDNLPSELPREASMYFSTVLYKYIQNIAEADYTVYFDELDLPAPIKKAIILYKGRLTPDYRYLEPHVFSHAE